MPIERVLRGARDVEGSLVAERVRYCVPGSRAAELIVRRGGAEVLAASATAVLAKVMTSGME